MKYVPITNILLCGLLAAQPQMKEPFRLDEAGRLLLNRKISQEIPGLRTDLRNYSVLLGRQETGEDRISKRALVAYLGSGLNVPPAVRQSAVRKMKQETDRIYGESDIFPPGAEDLFNRLRENNSLPGQSDAAARPRLASLSAAVGLIVPTSSISVGFDSSYLFATAYGPNYGLCPSTPDFGTPSVKGSGTGFLIAGGRVVTAGHCVDDLGDDLSIIFGYTDQLPTRSLDGGFSFRIELKGEGVIVRKLSKLLKPEESEYGIKGDWAVLKLSEDVPGTITPLAINEDDTPPDDNQNLVMMGHPCGMPIRTAAKGHIIHKKEGDNHFMTNLDAFIGNSGSPVFNGTTWKVEGILTQGGEDFVPVQYEGCSVWLEVSEDPSGASSGKVGEKVTRIHPVATAIR